MAEITNKGIYQLIERAAQAELWINDIRYSDFWLAETKDNTYPVLIVDITGGSYTNYPRRKSFNCVLTLLDQRREDNQNFGDALASTRNVLEDICVRLMSSPYSSDYGVRFLSEPSSESIKWEGSSNDRTIGTQMSFEISVPSSICATDLPLTVGSAAVPCDCPEPVCDSVISNVFAQGGTLITSASTQAGGVFSTTLSDLVISNNSPLQLLSVSKVLNNYFLPDIEWQNSNGTDISSFLPVYYEELMQAPDITISNINGDQSFTVALSGSIGLDFSSVTVTSTSNIKVQNSAETSLYSAPNFPCGSAATITVGDSLTRLYTDDTRAIIISGFSTPATDSVLLDIPYFNIINQDGQSASTVSWSGNVYTNFTSEDAQSEIVNTAGQSLSSVTVAAGATATTVISDSLISNSNSSYQVSLPATSAFTIEDLTVINQDGQSASGIVYSGTVYTSFSGGGGGGLVYNRPDWMGQTTSFTTGDVGYHVSAGTYNYQSTGSTLQKLDWSIANPFFALTELNEFGTYFRFTDDQGDEADDGEFDFVDNWAVNRPSATPYYIIDHLTGLAWIQIKVGMSQNWATAQSTAFSYSYSGYTGFRMPSIAEVTSVLRSGSVWYLGNNLFYRNSSFVSGSEIYMWLSDTDETISTGNAFRIQNGKDIVRAGKTSTSNYATYIVRTHY